MHVVLKRLVGPEYMLAAMRSTRYKDISIQKIPKSETWYRMLLSEHSPIRSVKYRVILKNIPYYAHVYLIRHHEGFEPYVFSQRDDKGVLDVTERDSKPQGEPISMMFDINAQALITIAKKRLCYKSHKVVRNVLKLIKVELSKGDTYDQILGNLMMKNCEWWSGLCQEPESCGKVKNVENLFDIHIDRFVK